MLEKSMLLQSSRADPQRTMTALHDCTLWNLEHSLYNVEQANTSQTLWKKNKSDSVDLWPLKVISKKVKFINNRHYILRSKWKCSKWPMVLYSSPKYNGTGTSFFCGKSLRFLSVYLKPLYELYAYIFPCSGSSRAVP
jgi:hypothetical protein